MFERKLTLWKPSRGSSRPYFRSLTSKFALSCPSSSIMRMLFAVSLPIDSLKSGIINLFRDLNCKNSVSLDIDVFLVAVVTVVFAVVLSN